MQTILKKVNDKNVILYLDDTLKQDILTTYTLTFDEGNWYFDELEKAITHINTLIDIGAYVGDTAIYFTLFKPFKKYILIEPNTYLHYIMIRNLLANNIKEFIIYPLAIGKSGYYFTYNDRPAINEGLITEHTGSVYVHAVQGLYPIFSFEREPSLIKIDCESSCLNYFSPIDFVTGDVVLIEVNNHEQCKKITGREYIYKKFKETYNCLVYI
jgi:FkbM family methyltransferase